MPIISRLLNETFRVYTQRSDAEPNDIGEMPEPTASMGAFSTAFSTAFSIAGELEYKGSVDGRITPGDSLEPDVLGTQKDISIDVTSMWIGFFDIPVDFEIHSGDWVIDEDDSTRKFQVQFIDRYPGGLSGHHYESRLQTTELERN